MKNNKVKITDIQFSWDEDENNGLDYNCLDLPDDLELEIKDVDDEAEYDAVYDFLHDYLCDKYSMDETPDYDIININVDGFEFEEIF
jgi:hypothetical protein